MCAATLFSNLLSHARLTSALARRKRHKERQSAAAHQPQALKAGTPPPRPPRDFKRALPSSGAEMQSWLRKQRMSVATLEREANSCGCCVQKRTHVEELRVSVSN